MLKTWSIGITYLLLTGCIANHVTDLANGKFTSWVSEKSYNFSEYFVVEMTGCNTCTSQIIRLIQDGYLSKFPEKAIVLVIDDRAELYPVQSFVNSENLLYYDTRKNAMPILDYLPRIYKREKDGSFSYKVLKIEDFENKINIMNMELTMDSYWDGSIKHTITGIAIPGNEAFMIINKNGNSYQDIMIFDAETNH